MLAKQESAKKPPARAKAKKQKDIFAESEGDGWFQRNNPRIDQAKIDRDPILKVIERLQLKRSRVLEVGCSSGWRLEEMRKRYGSHGLGIDPSQEAIDWGQQRYPELELKTGTADQIPVENQQFDLIIVGFCLYLCDREDLFKIAQELDRLLADGGCQLLLDFYAEIPYQNTYVHQDGLYSYKMNNASMFTWHPHYQLLSQDVVSHDSLLPTAKQDDQIAIQVVRKQADRAFIQNPYA